MTTWRRELVPLILIAAMFVTAALSWGSAPSRIPVHWSISGAIDGYGGKTEGLLAIPLLALGIYVLMLVLPRLDPGRANYARFEGPYYTIRLALITLMAVLYGFIQLAIRHPKVEVAAFMPIPIGGLFIVLGNLMGKLRPNWFVGVRTPWTLSSKQAWTRTHRLAGKVFLAYGLLLLPSGFLGRVYGFVVLVGGLVVLVTVLFVYSYLVWKHDPERIPPAGTEPAEDNRRLR